tara:strand:+ start:11784 stop:12092 length:309 start_codon:yes stop_codon:yes gene_type:complete
MSLVFEFYETTNKSAMKLASHCLFSIADTKTLLMVFFACVKALRVMPTSLMAWASKTNAKRAGVNKGSKRVLTGHHLPGNVSKRNVSLGMMYIPSNAIPRRM